MLSTPVKKVKFNLCRKKPSGLIVILVQSIDDNTTVKVTDVLSKNDDQYLLRLLMIVNVENTEYKAFIHHQEVDVIIDP